MKETNNEKIILCKSCQQEYDAALAACPHCGAKNEAVKKQPSAMDIADYGGGFGPKDSVLNRASLVIILVLLVALLAAAIGLGVKAMSLIRDSKPVVEDASASVVEPVDEGEVPEEEPVEETLSLSVNYADINLAPKQSTRLVVTAEPADWSGELTWTTSDKFVATVDAAGQVCYVGGGECVITVSSGESSVECKVTCSGAEAEKKGKTKESVKGQYPVVIQSEDKGQDEDKSDKSEKTDKDDKQDKQDKQDKDTPEQDKIPAKEEKPEVEKPSEDAGVEITLNYYDITLANMGDGTQLKASGGNGTFKWKSSDPSVATVNENGLVIRKGKGTIKVTCTSGDKSKECIVRAP